MESGRSGRIPSTMVVNIKSVTSGAISGESHMAMRSQVKPRHSREEILTPSSAAAEVTFSMRTVRNSGHSL